MGTRTYGSQTGPSLKVLSRQLPDTTEGKRTGRIGGIVLVTREQGIHISKERLLLLIHSINLKQ